MRMPPWHRKTIFGNKDVLLISEIRSLSYYIYVSLRVIIT